MATKKPKKRGLRNCKINAVLLARHGLKHFVLS